MEPRPAVGPMELDAFGGRLSGTDEGEWGGELLFKSPAGVVRLFRQNVRGIYRVPSGVVVFTGLAHLTENEGAIHEVKETPNGLMTRRLFRLVGVPGDIVQRKDGSIGFSASTDEWKDGEPVDRCFELTTRARLRGIPCRLRVGPGS